MICYAIESIDHLFRKICNKNGDEINIRRKNIIKYQTCRE